MSPRALADYCCSSCGYQTPRWLGRCPECGTWGSLEERPLSPRPGRERAKAGDSGPPNQPRPITEVDSAAVSRFGSGLPELSRVLGGGYVPAATFLVAGEPGIGKSTLLLQSAAAVARERSVLYVSGEEALPSIRCRADRLGAVQPRLHLLAETDLDHAIAAAEALRPELLVLDSVQTCSRRDLPGAPGSVSQVREAALALSDFARATGGAVVLLGHVNKEGNIAGPKALEHLVDVVLSLGGDRYHPYRILRCAKNRFGPAGEIGVFAMTGRGLESVANPSAAFLTERPRDTPGSTVTAVLTGARPLLVEVQALVGRRDLPTARRVVQSVDPRRVTFLLAVLENALKLPLGGRDVYVNAVGGVRVEEPAADLAICLSVLSSLRAELIPPDLLVVGEVGLTGELRRVEGLSARLREARELGFRAALVPQGGAADLGEAGFPGLAVRPAGNLREAVAALYPAVDAGTHPLKEATAADSRAEGTK